MVILVSGVGKAEIVQESEPGSSGKAIGSQPFLSQPDKPHSIGDLKGYRLIPSRVSLRGRGSSHSFLVLAEDSQGLEIDITSDCRFSV